MNCKGSIEKIIEMGRNNDSPSSDSDSEKEYIIQPKKLQRVKSYKNFKELDKSRFSKVDEDRTEEIKKTKIEFDKQMDEIKKIKESLNKPCSTT